MLDLKNLKNALLQLETERGFPHEKMIEMVESAIAVAYKKEYGKHNQSIRAKFNFDTGEIGFFQCKIAIEPDNIVTKEEKQELPEEEQENKIVFDQEKHILIQDAQKIRSNIKEGEEVLFELEKKTNFGRIAAQTAKQAIMQKLREAEKDVVVSEYADKEGDVVTGQMRRFERGNVYVDLGRTVAILPFKEQIRGERFKQGEQIRAMVLEVNERANRGNFITLSRADPQFIENLFKLESPEIASGQVKIRKIVRDPGFRTKLLVSAENGEAVDPVGALVGQRGVRVLTVMNELRGEKIDVIEYTEDVNALTEEALSPAEIAEVQKIDDNSVKAIVNEDQVEYALGFEGKNILLASKILEKELYLYTSTEELIAKADGKEIEIYREENNTETEKENQEMPTEEEKETKTEESEIQEESSDETPDVEKVEGESENEDKI